MTHSFWLQNFRHISLHFVTFVTVFKMSRLTVPKKPQKWYFSSDRSSLAELSLHTVEPCFFRKWARSQRQKEVCNFGLFHWKCIHIFWVYDFLKILVGTACMFTLCAFQKNRFLSLGGSFSEFRRNKNFGCWFFQTVWGVSFIFPAMPKSSDSTFQLVTRPIFLRANVL